MLSTRFTAAFLAVLTMLPAAAFSQTPQPSLHLPSSTPPAGNIKLDVFVETKSGQPVTTLQQQDFTVLDNKSTRPVTSFRVATATNEPVSVILYLDASNTPYELLAQIRNGADQFFKSNEGKLAYPTTFAILTDDGAQFDHRFSVNGMELSSDLEHDQVGFRQIFRGVQWGNRDRLDLGLKTIHQAIALASKMPGRKIVLFLSPGFPLLSGPDVQITQQQQHEIYSDAIYISTQMRRHDITFYDINPIGVTQSVFQANYYKNFLNGIARSSDAQFASLSFQVLSVQSGGQTLISNNDIPGMIKKCLADAASWYQISFDPAPSSKAHEFHSIAVHVDQPHLVVRTRNGYYANPTPLAVR